jgi:hypothetical protein
MAAGCGASHNPGVASIGKPPTTKAKTAPSHNVSGPFADALEFAHCMRSHGVGDFPDPQNPGGFSDLALARLDTTTSRYISANNTCQRQLPNDGQPTPSELQASVINGLKFARCMRAHGLKFPDPGMLGNQMTINFNDIGNWGSPQYQSAALACQTPAG